MPLNLPAAFPQAQQMPCRACSGLVQLRGRGEEAAREEMRLPGLRRRRLLASFAARTRGRRSGTRRGASPRSGRRPAHGSVQLPLRGLRFPLPWPFAELARGSHVRVRFRRLSRQPRRTQHYRVDAPQVPHSRQAVPRLRLRQRLLEGRSDRAARHGSVLCDLARRHPLETQEARTAQRFFRLRQAQAADLEAPVGAGSAAHRLPLSDTELTRIYEACDRLPATRWRSHLGSGECHAGDVKTMTMLLCWTGLRISAAATFDMSRVTRHPRGGANIFLHMHKTRGALSTWVDDWLYERLLAREHCLARASSPAAPRTGSTPSRICGGAGSIASLTRRGRSSAAGPRRTSSATRSCACSSSAACRRVMWPN